MSGNERPYRPPNGTEGEMFMSRWCYQCVREAGNVDGGPDGCEILTATLIYDVGDPGYPREWVATGPRLADARCTAFEPVNKT